MLEDDRLCRLQMGEARGERTEMLAGLCDERIGEIDDALAELARLVAEIELEVVRGLVVARASGPELAAERTEALAEAALEKAVYVLVLFGGRDAAGSEILGDGDEARHDRGAFRGIEEPGALELPGMGAGRGEVVRHKPEMARVRPRQPHQGGIRGLAKAGAPQARRILGHVRLRKSLFGSPSAGHTGRGARSVEAHRRAIERVAAVEGKVVCAGEIEAERGDERCRKGDAALGTTSQA